MQSGRWLLVSAPAPVAPASWSHHEGPPSTWWIEPTMPTPPPEHQETETAVERLDGGTGIELGGQCAP